MSEQHRELPDGRVLSLYVQIFNYKLTVSSPGSWPNVFDEAW